jgi:AcrR family transcriptional regulator
MGNAAMSGHPSVSSTPATSASDTLLDATEAIVRSEGVAAISTRRVAQAANMPLSQIHYHFGSKRGLVLALLKRENSELLKRQTELYGSDLPLSRKWQLACDYLEEDMRSGYVRILHEMIAAGYGDDAIANEVRGQLGGWYRLIREACGQANEQFSSIGPFSPEELAILVGQCFLGIETLMLLNLEEAWTHGLSGLRKFGAMIEAAEKERVDG